MVLPPDGSRSARAGIAPAEESMKNLGLFEKSFWRALLPLALPIALQNLLMTSFRLVDTLMIGRLGDVSIAAVGLAGQVSFLVELIGFGLSSGSAVFIAQYHGAGNLDGIRRTFGATILFGLPAGLLATAAALLFPEEIMGLLTNEQPLIEEGARYLRYACFSYAALTVYQSLCTTLRSTEQVRLPLISSSICAAANAALNYLFIFGGLGIAPMGVAGAGLATAITSILNPAIILAVSFVQKNILIAPLKKLLALRGFFLTYWKRVLPVLINELLWSLSIVGLNMVFGRMGTENYAALTVMRTIENIVFVFFVGICNACNILVGKHIGAGEIELGKRYAKRFLCLVPVFGVVLGTLVVLLRTPVLSLFDISEAARSMASAMLIVYAVDVSIRNIPYLCVVGIFRAGGDTRTGLIGDVSVQYFLVLPTVILCGLVLKLPFFWTFVISLIVDDAGKLAVYLPRFLSMKWIQPVTTRQ